MKTVLQVAYSPALADERQALLATAGYRVITAHTNSEARLACERQTFDVILLGYAAPLPIRKEMFSWLRDHCPGVPVISLYSRNFMPVPRADYTVDADDRDVWMRVLNQVLA